MIRAVVVEDQTPVAQYLVTLLDGTSRVEVIGTATDGVEALRLCAQLRPDAAFLDINLPGQGGISLGTQLTKLTPPPRLVFTAESVDRATDAFGRVRDVIWDQVRRALADWPGRDVAALAELLGRLVTDVQKEPYRPLAPDFSSPSG